MQFSVNSIEKVKLQYIHFVNFLLNLYFKYAKSKCRLSPIVMSQYTNYISSTILEERDIKGHTMDVFNRLLMDRILQIIKK